MPITSPKKGSTVNNPFDVTGTTSTTDVVSCVVESQTTGQQFTGDPKSMPGPGYSFRFDVQSDDYKAFVSWSNQMEEVGFTVA